MTEETNLDEALAPVSEEQPTEEVATQPEAEEKPAEEPKGEPDGGVTVPLKALHEVRDANKALKAEIEAMKTASQPQPEPEQVPDPIEDARERESIETGLLERSWLEEDVELEVESPLVSFFRGKE